MKTLAERLEGIAKRVDAYARVLGICDQNLAGTDAEDTANDLRELAAEVASAPVTVSLEVVDSVVKAICTDKESYVAANLLGPQGLNTYLGIMRRIKDKPA